jgi:hypothetical protein
MPLLEDYCEEEAHFISRSVTLQGAKFNLRCKVLNSISFVLFNSARSPFRFTSFESAASVICGAEKSGLDKSGLDNYRKTAARRAIREIIGHLVAICGVVFFFNFDGIDSMLGKTI